MTHRLRKIRSPYADLKYSADDGPLPHISASWSRDINRLYCKYVTLIQRKMAIQSLYNNLFVANFLLGVTVKKS